MSSTSHNLMSKSRHSLNISAGVRKSSVFPFLGASPAPVSAGIRACFDPLAHLRRDALDLLASLDETQRSAAVLSGRPPRC